MPKDLEQLTEKEFETLKESGLLRVIYPDAPLHWTQIYKPVPLENPDLTELREGCKIHLDNIIYNGYINDHEKQYIYDLTLKTIFGENIFDYINKKLK